MVYPVELEGHGQQAPLLHSVAGPGRVVPHGMDSDFFAVLVHARLHRERWHAFLYADEQGCAQLSDRVV